MITSPRRRPVPARCRVACVLAVALLATAGCTGETGEKESESSGTAGSLRREIWIRPDGGRRVHRTAVRDAKEMDSEEEDLASLSCQEVSVP